VQGIGHRDHPLHAAIAAPHVFCGIIHPPAIALIMARERDMHMILLEVQRDGFTISSDPARLDMDAICSFLARSYWAAERDRDTTRRAVEHSLCFGVYEGERQIGFARVVTDCATFAWLADVFVDENYRGRGLGKWLVQTVLSHPDLQSVPRWFLATRDAHELYRRFGFAALTAPERRMELNRPTEGV
jgi:GNAT superfamily N-acetyltransferase